MGNNQNWLQRKPPGAPCAFIQQMLTQEFPGDYWTRTPLPICAFTQSKLRISTIVQANADNWQYVVFPNAAWLDGTGTVRGCYRNLSDNIVQCGVDSAYVTSTVLGSANIDVWKALNDGLWASSVTFVVIFTMPYDTVAYEIFVRTTIGNNLPKISEFRNSTGPAKIDSCNYTSYPGIMYSVTMYDDGTLTLT